MSKKVSVLAVLSAMILMVIAYLIYSNRQIKFGSFRNSNVLLITIDTLRADHLSSYGYSQIKTPAIDRLANQSVVFEDAVAHVPMTLPSHVSILTGLLPFSHGVRDNAGFSLSAQINTLPEILKNHGYKTAAFVSAFVLDSQFKLDQGFDFYSDDFTLAEARVINTDVYRRAADTQVEVDAWLKENNRSKWFLWVHYYDPHDPYEPPEPYRTVYAKSPYDGEIAYTDEIAGKLLKSLENSGISQQTIVVLTGDHGEGLGEHKERTHSLFVYNATQHVPLMIRLPKVEPGRVRQPVGHIDIAPTLLDLLGIATDPEMQGKSLIPAINGKEDFARSVYSESIFPELHYGWSPFKSITTREYKFIDAPKPELYDRQTDRAETRNLISENPGIGKQLRAQMEEIIRTHRKTPENTPQAVDPETEEKLRSLGYVGTTVTATEQSRKIDPKDKIDLLESLSRAARAMEIKNYPLVLELTNGVLKQDPDLVDAHFLAASAYLHLEERERALEQMLITIRLKPDHTLTLYNLAFFYQLQGNLTAAEYWYLQLLKYEPYHLFGNLNLAGLYRQRKDFQKAEPYISKIVKSYEDALRTTVAPRARSRLFEKVAEIRFKTGDLNRSLKDLEEAVKADPGNHQAWSKLGSLYRETGRIQEAEAAFQKAMDRRH